MIYTEMTKKALKLCFEAHKNQVDKSGMPYVFHPFHLAEQMEDENTATVALLHDVVEDTEYSLDDLKNMGFPQQVIEALGLLTHDKSVPYMDYIAEIKKNPIAKAVKLADLKHNSDLSRLDIIDEKATSDFFNISRNGLKYGTNNDIGEIVGEHNGKAVYSMLGRVSDFVMTDNHRTYYPGINTDNGRISNVDLGAGEFLFDMRDVLLNIDGVMEAQPILLPRDDGSLDGYPVANITIRHDCSPVDILKAIHSHYKERNHKFVPMGIIFRTRFARSLSSDKREVISLLDVRTGYYKIGDDGQCYKVQFPKGQKPISELMPNPDEITCVDPPAPKLVYSSIKR
ncbi:MAG: bifunctional (p)ppGpp synthetase/guanosine-3',5'-bis(diphosphate) 3'-pyrophosphohydrolase [Clostridia bacterium]|nr:bifunctional (p)ppGpp synthetase/guanosine-3',5'-bis(diphosphate) 3'-pyrophosphohydrolase [Clostridia bacterium]